VIKPPCLLLHGFTGGPFEVQPLADYLQFRGRPCEVPRLLWHGEHRLDLEKANWMDWVQAAEIEAKQMVEHYGSFDLVGFSMGGLMAAYLSVRYPVRKLVLLNTSIVYVSPGRFIRVVHEDWRSGELIPLSKMKSTPLRATWQFTRLVRHLKPELTRVHVPTLIAQGQRDQVIHPHSAKFIYNKLGGQRELKWFPRSKHLICLGEEAQQLFHEVDDFLAHE
jgi:carboxylesterase